MVRAARSRPLGVFFAMSQRPIEIVCKEKSMINSPKWGINRRKISLFLGETAFYFMFGCISIH